jgi:hypothetical protein
VKQQEFREMMKNWWSSNEFCWWRFLMNLQFLEGKTVRNLGDCDSDPNSVTIKALYSCLITLLITN